MPFYFLIDDVSSISMLAVKAYIYHVFGFGQYVTACYDTERIKYNAVDLATVAAHTFESGGKEHIICFTWCIGCIR